MNLLKKITSLVALVLIANATLSAQNSSPRDGFYNRYLHTEKMPLPYDHIHEKDVFWEKRVWREIVLDEKMNHSFKNPKAPFINILLDAAKKGNIAAYSTWDDQFTQRLSKEETESLGRTIDTVLICEPENFFDLEPTVVVNELNPDDVKKMRVKEVWYFDEETSQMNVRILGIAPIISRYDDNGNYLNEGPMFWAYYPELRTVLAQHEVMNGGNDAAPMTWEDIFEARMFSSYITKQSNNMDNRIKDIHKDPITALLESNKIKNEHLNFEHDLWSY